LDNVSSVVLVDSFSRIEPQSEDIIVNKLKFEDGITSVYIESQIQSQIFVIISRRDN